MRKLTKSQQHQLYPASRDMLIAALIRMALSSDGYKIKFGERK